MDFIDINNLKKNTNQEGQFIDRKVICDICSTLQDNFYVHKVGMIFDPKENVYTCPNYEICKQRVSGLTVEKLLYFNNRDFIYDPEVETKEATLKVGFAGLDEDDEIPEADFVSLEDERQEP